MAGFRSSQVIIGIAGELVKGFTTSVSQERKKPDQQLSARELDTLIETVQREALQGGRADRSPGRPACPTSTSASSTRRSPAATIDGYTVTNPVGFHGRHVRISIFNAFAPLIHLGALQTVASMLDLELVAIVAEPYAVARCMDDEQVQQAGALFIDVGGGTTDVALVRQGGIEGTRMFALGGRAFTKILADRLELPFARAEEVKVDFAKGVKIDRARRGRRDRRRGRGRLGGRRRAGARGVRQDRACCPAASTCAGEGHACRRSAPRCAIPQFARHLPFARPPQVEAITVDEVGQVSDTTGLLVDEQDIPPMALAHQALEMSAPEAPLDAALRRVLRQMKV